MSAPGETATRRRGRALESAIFTATLEQLAEVGYPKLTMEGVAEAAGTGKAALYRRWPGKEDLVFAALADALPRPREIPEHATVREDLIALFECYKQVHTVAHGAAFRALKEESGRQYSRVHDVIRATVTGPIRELLLAALERGVERGDVRPGAVTPRVASLGPALMSYYCITENPVVPDGFVVSIVDEVMLPLISPSGPGPDAVPHPDAVPVPDAVPDFGAAPDGGGQVTRPAGLSPRPDTAAAAS